MNNQQTRTLKFSQSRTSKLRKEDFITLYTFSKMIYQKTPEPSINREFIEAAKITMQKCCRHKDEITCFYDMVYIAQEFINHWDELYKYRHGYSNLSMD